MIRRVRVVTWIAVAGLLTGCGDDDGGTGPSATCEFAGITSRDASGILLTEDPDDWCDEVSAYPNPMVASGSIRIRVTLARAQSVRVAVQSEEDGELRVLVNEVRSAGVFEYIWDLRTASGIPVGPGIYCVTVLAEDFTCSGDLEVL